MKIPRTESAYDSKVVYAVLFAFFFLTFAFDAYSMDPSNKLDFDGDGKADIAIYREGNVSRSSQTYSQSVFWYWSSLNGTWEDEPWGLTLDVPIPADYVGNAKTDLAIFRWFTPGSAPYDTNAIWISGLPVTGFGNTYGRKMGRNFDNTYGGQKAELGEFQHVNIYADSDSDPPFYQYIFYWQTGATSLDYKVTNIPLGQSASSYTQVPVAEDYDGDGKSEIAVFNVNTGCYHVWFGTSSTPLDPPPCFGSGYAPAPGDYDRDGRADYGVFKATSGSNNFEWKFISSQTGTSTTFPMTTTVNGTGKPVAADYDGDGVTDYAIAQSSGGNWHWTIRNTGCPALPASCSPTTGAALTFGMSSDTLLASPYFNDSWY